MAANPELEAGALDRYVDLLAPIYNGTEDEIEDWQKVASVWGMFTSVAAVEGTDSLRTVSQVICMWTIRYRDDVDARWRVVDAGRTYQVEGLQDTLGRRAKLMLNCRRVL